MLHNGSQPLYSSILGTVKTNQQSITELCLHKCPHLKEEDRRYVLTFCIYQWRLVRSALWLCLCPRCTVPRESCLTPYNKQTHAFYATKQEIEMIQFNSQRFSIMMQERETQMDYFLS